MQIENPLKLRAHIHLLITNLLKFHISNELGLTSKFYLPIPPYNYYYRLHRLDFFESAL